ncbi:MAG: hypothetical protein KatS3mg096_525 [Candidatus Parcubacteria bacterium]|nr:MAG: hypothetical protein KatS3mg096_525 [Candidatus Parcubacteria bacterium]
MLKLDKMKQKTLNLTINQRLTTKKDWDKWLKAFGIWRNKKGPEPKKWQSKIRENRKLN